MDDRLDMVSYREHMAARAETDKRIAALELEHARIGAQLLHLPEDVRELTKAVNAMLARQAQPAQPAPTAPDNTLLAIHRLLDSVATKSSGGLAERIGTAIVYIGFGAAIAVLSKLATGFLG